MHEQTRLTHRGTKELELELMQTHMTQKPMLRVEVGALGALQVKNMRGGGPDRRESARRLCGWVWVFWPRLGLSLIFLTGYSSCVFVVVSSLVSLVSRASCFQPGTGVSWL